MIFVTVGTQLPFDRMMRAVDAWAGSAGRDDVFAQIGPDAWKPSNIAWSEFVSPEEFDQRAREAEVIVGHAGMGSILTALRYGKPVVIMPRKAALREQRNDHQLATAERFRGRPGVSVAPDEAALVGLLGRIGELASAEPISPHADPRLIARLRAFITDANAAPVRAREEGA